MHVRCHEVRIASRARTSNDRDVIPVQPITKKRCVPKEPRFSQLAVSRQLAGIVVHKHGRCCHRGKEEELNKNSDQMRVRGTCFTTIE